MNLINILDFATDKRKFENLEGFIGFCLGYLTFIEKNLQAKIISQNENQYQFFQYGHYGSFQITRPINSTLFYTISEFELVRNDFISILKGAQNGAFSSSDRSKINNSIYTIQQSIGAALDALPPGKSNKARKINGDLFEQFIRLVFQEMGIQCRSGVIKVPVVVDKETKFDMNYQHDLIIEQSQEIRAFGTIKTSSKDRLDKMFVDKFLYNRLTSTSVPHIAVILNDVQRKNSKKENEYGINATFLPGHFKGYTIKLNPLDGVYYCDIRPNMLSDSILKEHIKTLDTLLLDDIWDILKMKSTL